MVNNEFVTPSVKQFVERLCSMLIADGVHCTPQIVTDLGFTVWLEKQGDRWVYWFYRNGDEVTMRDFIIEIMANDLATKFKQAINNFKEEEKQCQTTTN